LLKTLKKLDKLHPKIVLNPLSISELRIRFPSRPMQHGNKQ
jgi:hypothetical protein